MTAAGTVARRRRLLGLAALGPLACVGRPAGAADAPRIVSVGAAITETLYALGAEGDIVGVDTTSLYPAAATRLPRVGYQRTLSAEGVLSLAPTMLLGTEEAGPPAVLRQIEAARVPVHVVGTGHSFEGVVARSLRVAELAGRQAAGEALAGRLRADWQAAQAHVAGLAPRAAEARPRVLFLMVQSVNQMLAAGSGTAPDALIAYAGGRNAFGDAKGYKPLSPEAAVAAAPDVIVTTDHGLGAAGGSAELLRGPGLAQTPAGRAQRVVSIDILLALGFGPRLPLAVTTLAEALHRPAPRR